jgi:hypothetical protein
MLLWKAACAPVQYVYPDYRPRDMIKTNISIACDKAVTENKLPTSTCACGKRAEGKSHYHVL